MGGDADGEAALPPLAAANGIQHEARENRAENSGETAKTAVSVGETPIRSAMPIAIGAVTDLATKPPTIAESAPSRRAIPTALAMAVTPPASSAASKGRIRPRIAESPL